MRGMRRGEERGRGRVRGEVSGSGRARWEEDGRVVRAAYRRWAYRHWETGCTLA